MPLYKIAQLRCCMLPCSKISPHLESQHQIPGRSNIIFQRWSSRINTVMMFTLRHDSGTAWIPAVPSDDVVPAYVLKLQRIDATPHTHERGKQLELKSYFSDSPIFEPSSRGTSAWLQNWLTTQYHFLIRCSYNVPSAKCAGLLAPVEQCTVCASDVCHRTTPSPGNTSTKIAHLLETNVQQVTSITQHINTPCRVDEQPR